MHLFFKIDLEIRKGRDFDTDQVNKDGKKPPFPPVQDLNRKSVNIKKISRDTSKTIARIFSFK